MVIRGNSNQPILDLYPIVVDLDNEALDNSFSHDTSRTSIYDAVSCLASERSWMIEDQADTETPSTSTEALPTPARSPSQRSRHSRCQSFQDPSLDENLQNPPPIRRYRSFGSCWSRCMKIDCCNYVVGYFVMQDACFFVSSFARSICTATPVTSTVPTRSVKSAAPNSFFVVIYLCTLERL